jgi:hypothetical protein
MHPEVPFPTTGAHWLEIQDGPMQGGRIFVDQFEASRFQNGYFPIAAEEVGLIFWHSSGCWCGTAEDGLPIYTLDYEGITNLKESWPPREEELVVSKESWRDIFTKIKHFFWQ